MNLKKLVLADAHPDSGSHGQQCRVDFSCPGLPVLGIQSEAILGFDCLTQKIVAVIFQGINKV